MIKDIRDYKYYLNRDRIALGVKRKKPRFIGDEIWKFERLLRKLEYYSNCKSNNYFYKIYILYLRYVYRNKSIKLGFSIGINVFGPGLSIAHRGTIVVNGNTKVGENCRIHVCTNIGTKAGFNDKAPIIGDNVYIAPGVKIFGDIKIGNNIAIGANSVVNKSFEESNITIAGIPAKIINRKGSKDII